jgi:hypothetical protein
MSMIAASIAHAWRTRRNGGDNIPARVVVKRSVRSVGHKERREAWVLTQRSCPMPDLLTVGPDEIIKVWRDSITHTFKGERCVGAPFEQLFVQFHGCRTVQIDIRKSAVRDGMPTCVPGLVMLRDELNKIIDEYTGTCPTCKRHG